MVVVLVMALGWLAFSVIIFFRNRAQMAEMKTAVETTAALLWERFHLITCHKNHHRSTAGHSLRKRQRGPSRHVFVIVC